MASNSQGGKNQHSLWVDKYKPVTSSQIIGQQGDNSCVKKLANWLKNWHRNLDKKPGFGRFGSDDGSGFRAALLSGPPGIGKTTSAQLVCKEAGMSYVELNASDTRNKKSLEQEVRELLHNQTLAGFGKSGKALSDKHVLIMDEVDGMSGNEDRGGVQELILLIKKTKVPIICICNDRSHQKMRSLVNYCFDLRFYKPRIEQIKAAMMSIAFKEKIRVSCDALHELVVSSNQDMRQVLHFLSLMGPGNENAKIESLLNNKDAIKDVKLGPFDALRKVFSSGEEYARMSFQDKADLFFSDYSLMPLFVFENYLNVNPKMARNKESEKLKLISKTADRIAFGDLIEKEIRTSNNWSLLPLEAAFASVMPGAYMNGQMTGQIVFPSLLGKISTTNKRQRLLQELKMHMNLKITGSKSALNLDYLEPLKDSLIRPLLTVGAGGVPQVLDLLEKYFLRKEDIEAIIELTQWENQPDPMAKIDSKVKAALTRAYNKESFALPYSLGTVKKGRTKTQDFSNGEFGEEMDVDEAEEQENDDDNIDLDAMIKAKKPAKRQSKNDDKEKEATGNKTKKRKVAQVKSSPKKGRAQKVKK